MTLQQELLEQAQAESQKVYDRMMEMLLEYEPTQKLTIIDVKFIAEWARTISLTATQSLSNRTSHDL